MTANAYLFAVGDAAFEPARAVRLANKLTCISVVSDLVVYFRTRQAARFRARPDRHRLHRGYRHHGLCEQSIKFQIPGGVRAQSRYYAARDHLEDAAERVALVPRFVD